MFKVFHPFPVVKSHTTGPDYTGDFCVAVIEVPKVRECEYPFCMRPSTPVILYHGRSRINWLRFEDSYICTYEHTVVSHFFIRETASFSAFLPYSTLLISRVR